jgi:hypothetical protein
MMHTHLLSPVTFANDISRNPRYNKLAGNLDFPLLRLLNKLQNIDHYDPELRDRDRIGVDKASERKWHAKFKMPYEFVQTTNKLGDKTIPPEMQVSQRFNLRTFTFTPSFPFSLDLVEAVKRQMAFARKITALYPYDPVPDALLLDSQQRYAKFMNLIHLNTVSSPVPAMDIDLFWHTHQLFSSNYLPWCTHHIGHPVNHDDTTTKAELSSGLDEIIAAWGDNYFEDYLQPPPRDLTVKNPPAVIQQEPAPPPPPPPHGNPPPGSFPGPTTADKIPPPGLTPAQLRLWHFDVACQAEHEHQALLLLNCEADIVAATQEIIAFNKSQPVFTAADRASPFQALFRAVSEAKFGENTDMNQESRLISKRTQVFSQKDKLISEERELRKKWGRERWPLLCHARGWGDDRVTEGKFKRPPQGTMELPFPVFAATWYENKSLGYYNYITGRGVEGGGMRVGGGMCGAKFDGGNCSPKPHVRYQNDMAFPSGGCG